MNTGYVLPCLIKSKINIANIKLNKLTPPQKVSYEHMELKEFTRSTITQLWTTIIKDTEKLSELGNVIISCYPVTNKDKVLKEYFINNKYKILEIYNEFDKLFNKILEYISDYHQSIRSARFMYDFIHFSYKSH